MKGLKGSPPAAEMADVVKRYPGVLALDRVSFSIQPGEVRALLGKNGAGKSTLIRMLTGAEAPDNGEVYISARRLAGTPELRMKVSADSGVRAVYQELSLVPSMNVAENMFMGCWPKSGPVIKTGKMHQTAADLLDELNFHIQTRSLVSSLSPARRQLVEIARAILGSPTLLILDEPTSSLASDEVNLVFDAVRQVAARGVAVLYVSHRMKEIRALASSATIMRDGSISGIVEVSDTGIPQIVQMMLGREKTDEVPIQGIDRDAEHPVVLEVKNLQEKPKLNDVSFSLYKGEVLGIAGLLGSGRTEILRLIAGLDSPERGTVYFEGKSVDGLSYRKRIAGGISITSENRKDDGIFPLLGVDENIVLCDWKQVSRGGIINPGLKDAKTSETVMRMKVKTSTNQAAISTLSGGNQQKIVIGRWLYADSAVLLLDEPTRGIDIEAKSQIYNLVRAFAAGGRSVVFVSSEIEELPAVCDRVLILRKGRIDKEFRAPNIGAEQLLSACINN